MRFASLSLLPLLASCLDVSSATNDDLTSVGGAEQVIEFDAFVDVAPNASDDVVKGEIHRQLKSAHGALREQGIGVADRDAVRNLANPTLVRTRSQVVRADGTVSGEVDRVRYHYRDTALVEHGQGITNKVELHLLFGDYIARAGELITIPDLDLTYFTTFQGKKQPKFSTIGTARKAALCTSRNSLYLPYL